MSIEGMQLRTSVVKSQFNDSEGRSTLSTNSISGCALAYQRVLIIEYRDEHYVDLKEFFESYGCQVSRAASSDVVSSEARIFSPDLILICERMPGESGCLIACKLRFGRLKQPIWLYTATGQPDCTDSQEWSGINDVFFYAGRLRRLRELLQVRLRSWPVGQMPLHGNQPEPVQTWEVDACRQSECNVTSH